MRSSASRAPGSDSIANFTHDQLEVEPARARWAAAEDPPGGKDPPTPPTTRRGCSTRRTACEPWAQTQISILQAGVDHRKEDSEDKLHNDHTTCHVMDPYAKWRIRWNIFVLILIIYVIIIVPLR